MVRTCIVCKKTCSKDLLLSLEVDAEGTVCLQAASEPVQERKTSAREVMAKPARRAYVCIQMACFQKLRSKAVEAWLKRLFPEAVKKIDLEVLLNALSLLTKRRMLESIGLARRLGIVVCGVENVLQQEQELVCGVVASDLAAHSQHKLARSKLKLVRFLTAREIGRAVGLGVVGVLGVKANRLAERLRYWSLVWQELSDAKGGEESLTPPLLVTGV